MNKISQAEDISSSKPICFVLMPISDPDGYVKGHFQHVFDDIVSPACDRAGFKALRADQVKQSNLIHLDIVQKLIDVPMAVCDLSSRNPNVLFELALRQAFDKPVALIQEIGTPPVFDISPFRYTEYRKELTYHEVLEDQALIATAIQETFSAHTDGRGINSIIKLLALIKPASLPEINALEARADNQKLIAEISQLREEMRAARRDLLGVIPQSVENSSTPRSSYNTTGDRLRSLTILISSLAHEIRDPLVTIKTFTQLLPDHIDDEKFRDYFLKVTSGEIDRLTSLINALLAFSQPPESRLEDVNANALIDKIADLVAIEARKKNITLSTKYAPDLPQLRIDAEHIKLVLLNMLLNGIQAIKGKGQIWIETRMVQVPTPNKTGPFVQIEIRDTGMGIPKENLERIFDPFFSTKPEGSGLGLAISYQIIHEHGGFINVESEVGKGTSFKVYLPLKKQEEIG